MKQIYVKDASGKKIYLEVTEEVAAAYRDCLREEWRSDAREKYHTVSLENGLLFLSGEEARAEERLIAAEERVERRNMLQRLRRALMSLTPLQRVTLYKLYVRGMTQTKIAEEEGSSVQAISDRVSRIFRKLKKLF